MKGDNILVEIDKYKTINGQCPFNDFIREMIDNGQEKELVQIRTYLKYL